MGGKGFIRGLIADAAGLAGVFAIFGAFLVVTTGATSRELIEGAVRALDMIGF